MRQPLNTSLAGQGEQALAGRPDSQTPLQTRRLDLRRVALVASTAKLQAARFSLDQAAPSTPFQGPAQVLLKALTVCARNIKTCQRRKGDNGSFVCSRGPLHELVLCLHAWEHGDAGLMIADNSDNTGHIVTQ